jgi:hypothetical protein
MQELALTLGTNHYVPCLEPPRWLPLPPPLRYLNYVGTNLRAVGGAVTNCALSDAVPEWGWLALQVLHGLQPCAFSHKCACGHMVGSW